MAVLGRAHVLHPDGLAAMAAGSRVESASSGHDQGMSVQLCKAPFASKLVCGHYVAAGELVVFRGGEPWICRRCALVLITSPRGRGKPPSGRAPR
jgi:hypothetical protein